MTILVAGGAGYIGSHAVRQLIDRGERVVVLDALLTGHKASIPEAAVFYEGDLRDRELVERVFTEEDIEHVMMFAAFSLVGESTEKPLAYYDNNVHGTQVLLEAMAAHGVSSIVFSSTAAVYGEPAYTPIEESADTKPESPYGETKLAMEKMMKWCEKAYGIRYVSLRYFNVGGARENGEIGEDHNPETHLIPIILQTALGQREHITIFGEDYPTPDGTCIRDYVHVEDLIEAHILALDYLKRGEKSNVFNLGSSAGFSVKQMIEAARKITGCAIPVRVGERRSGDPAQLVASSNRAKDILGWNPQRTTIDKIIADAWNWHQRSPNGYQERVER
ncbi:UDP-galactose 4-epimerase [Sinobaca qinghaiensis]|uniref:UDP-glucose 4-epimerase n=1 Tax=Sinobaca qinghaiensis TaxID=342944 RepID=A0A419V802_9BACL|nr:UDP-glucose 4-epimerase GalE [Sinobaca qinghaiensis]RKD76170.1 UDP-galactose 4-epimerase [Sinobaca qinghaiensis]